MHVVFWSPAWPLATHPNGIIAYVHAMKEELEERGHKVSILSGEVESTNNEARVYEVRYGLWRHAKRRLRALLAPGTSDVFNFSAAIASQILRIHRIDPIDVIEMEESFGWFSHVASRTGLPVAVRLHGPAFLTQMAEEHESTFGRDRVAREGVALRQCHTIISPSAVTLDRTIAQYGLSPVETRVIANPFSARMDLPSWRRENCDPERILFIGRFDLCKGADIALAAFQLLLKERPNLRLSFVGSDRGWRAPDGSWFHFQSYMQKMFPETMRDHVQFHGALPHKEVARMRAESMITVLTSRWENQSYALLEAMFQGCPIVSTDAGGCPESIMDGVNGRLARSECPQDFANKIATLLDDPDFAQALGEAAHRYVIEHHAIGTVATQALDTYHRLISHRPGRPPLDSQETAG